MMGEREQLEGGWGKEGEQEEGCREGERREEGGRVQGDGGDKGRERGRVRARGGREETMMLGRQRATVKEARVDEGNERGRDGTRHGRREGGSERWRD